MDLASLQRTWSIIQFLEDGSVEVVPSMWIQGNVCYWPSYPHIKLLNAIKKLEPLNALWQTHKVKVFENGIFDDYTKARAKAKTAEETSDLLSELEDSTKGKRKQERLSISNDESSFTLPSPPKICKKSTVVAEIKNSSSDEEEATIVERHDSDMNDRVVGNGKSNIEEVRSSCTSCIENKKFMESLMIQNHLIHTILTDVLSQLKDIQTKLSSKITIDEKSKSFFQKHENTVQFPINTIKQMELLETILINEEDFEDATKELSSLGGKNNYNFVKRALSCFISNDLALQYSWLGRKDKKDFHVLKLANVIILAAERAGLAGSKRESEIAIQLWLKRACDRKSSVTKNF